MAFYQFNTSQLVSTSLEELWHFIATPENLKDITPVAMDFTITTEDILLKMYPGMIISYTVRPFLGFKTNWVTEITQVKELHYFVDEQRIGPYNMWHHQHILEAQKSGVLMKDIISYQPPFGILGKVANHILIKRKLNEIFSYRSKVITHRFP
ncbi:SRPBCC family protein [Flavobacteriaceae bacterium F08102]|nr:SRPBCC family protein [Flavobacteriaceae bacterium F08102]